MSKLLNKYNNLKKENSNLIYLIKVGIFYNILNEDTKIVSEALGLKITSLSADIIKCGFPVSKIEKYTNLLKNKGINFKIVDDTLKEQNNNDYIKIISSNDIVKKILNIDFNNTTYIEAFNTLKSIQSKLKDIYKD